MAPRRKPTARRLVVRAPRTVIAPAPVTPTRIITLGGVPYGVAGGGQLLSPMSVPTDTSSGGQATTPTTLSPIGISGTATTDVNTGGPLGGISDFITKKLPAYFKIGAGGLGLIVSGLALVYVAGRNTAPAQAAKAVGSTVAPVGKVANKVAAKTETGQARAIARKTRTSERTERARSRVVTEGSGKVRVSSRREGADARQQGAEYRATKGQRDRERLSALRSERRVRNDAPRLHSKTRIK